GVVHLQAQHQADEQPRHQDDHQGHHPDEIHLPHHQPGAAQADGGGCQQRDEEPRGDAEADEVVGDPVAQGPDQPWHEVQWRVHWRNCLATAEAGGPCRPKAPRPPSTGNSTPVIIAASSEASQRMALACSWGSTARAMACWPAHISTISASLNRLRSMGVAVMPGRMALTRILWRA